VSVLLRREKGAEFRNVTDKELICERIHNIVKVNKEREGGFVFTKKGPQVIARYLYMIILLCSYKHMALLSTTPSLLSFSLLSTMMSKTKT
jgi:hypothetical protein